MVGRGSPRYSASPYDGGKQHACCLLYRGGRRFSSATGRAGSSVPAKRTWAACIWAAHVAYIILLHVLDLLDR